ncbi:hypothetical protein HF998_00935 [Cellulomonas hominis]|nr:bifunctional DNA primase/polymerase [Cellulomonas hominis]MBB5473296.1 hypothetical protein [Cellulomonas hominis]NKY05573.1 hypothetical protein [Cellulomonas hominis]
MATGPALSARQTARTALAIALAGVAVFPLAHGSTQPLEPVGVREATHDLAQVPRVVDSRNGGEHRPADRPGRVRRRGHRHLPRRQRVRRLPPAQGRRAAGRLGDEGRHPNDGLHIYFPARPDGKRDRAWPHVGVDFSGEGGYVAAPPSAVLRDDGSAGGYTVLERREQGWGYVDAAAIAELLPAPARQSTDNHFAARVAGIAHRVRDADPGQRAALLSWATRTCLEMGADLAPVIEAAVDAGLDSRQINQTVAAATDRFQGDVDHTPAPVPAPVAAVGEVAGP